MNLHNTNCLSLLKALPDNHIDAVVTDPPYGMSNHTQADIVEALSKWLAGEEYTHNKKGFMNLQWDAFVPSPLLWREVLRVLKPGGYILCASSTRTFDLMGISLRLAGFEIRDTITELYDNDPIKRDFFDSLSSEQLKLLQRGFGEQFTTEWIYSTGFPKSLDVGKAVDSLLNNTRELVGQKDSLHHGNGSQKYGFQINKTIDVTRGNSLWENWGSSIKPAHEPFIMARKPLEKGLTIAENCLKWGTGGLNIGECRIKTDEVVEQNSVHKTQSTFQKSPIGHPRHIGRFPANLVHDCSSVVTEKFPNSVSTGGVKGLRAKNYMGLTNGYTDSDGIGGYKDTGSNARFFYCAKPSKAERNRGCEHLETNQSVGGGGGIGDYLEDVNSASGKFGSEKAPSKNIHPTVKPLKLMEYLITLISREDAIILDPFMGSGTTGIAAKNLNRQFIGCEIDKSYYEIAVNRINAA